MSSSLFGQPIPLTYWDPANLLQITSDGDNDQVKINCVGRAVRDVRCRWEVLEPELSKVRPLLKEMSRTKPEAVTEDTLRRLASLCLCPNWHSNQLCRTANRWIGVVSTAALQNKNLIASVDHCSSDWAERLINSEMTTYSLSAQVASLTKQHQECQDANTSQKKAIASLEKYRQTLDARVIEESTARAKAERQSANLSDRIDKAERCLADYRTKISVFEEEKRFDKTRDLLRACQTNRDQLEEENGTLRANVSKLALVQGSLAACRAKKVQLERENETCRADFDKLEQARESLAADLHKLRVESSASRDSEKQLAAELSATNSLLKQCRADLAQERGCNATLNERIASFETSHTELMESISACWLHSFWAWVSRQRGLSKGSDSGMMSQETILQAAKV